MSDGLFNPDAFEQMPGQMSMEQVESKAARELRAFCEAPTEVREAYNAQVRADALGIKTVLGAWRPPCGSAHCVWLERCAGRADCPAGMGDER